MLKVRWVMVDLEDKVNIAIRLWRRYVSSGDTSLLTIRLWRHDVSGGNTSPVTICLWRWYVFGDDLSLAVIRLWQRYISGGDSSLLTIRLWRRYVSGDNMSLAVIPTSLVMICLWRWYVSGGDTSPATICLLLYCTINDYLVIYLLKFDSKIPCTTGELLLCSVMITDSPTLLQKWLKPQSKRAKKITRLWKRSNNYYFWF